MDSIHPINILQCFIYLLWFNGWHKWEMLTKWSQSWSSLHTSRNITNDSVQWMIPCNIGWLEYWNLIACTCLIIGLRWCTSHLILFIIMRATCTSLICINLHIWVREHLHLIIFIIIDLPRPQLNNIHVLHGIWKLNASNIFQVLIPYLWTLGFIKFNIMNFLKSTTIQIPNLYALLVVE